MRSGISGELPLKRGESLTPPLFRKPRNKYHNKHTVIDGITFASGKEGARYTFLKSLKRSGVIEDFELQPKFLLLRGFRKCCRKVWPSEKTTSQRSRKCPKCGKVMELFRPIHYIADFRITMPDGREHIEDVKGRVETPEFKLKRKLFEERYPELTLEIIKDIQEIPA